VVLRALVARRGAAADGTFPSQSRRKVPVSAVGLRVAAVRAGALVVALFGVVFRVVTMTSGYYSAAHCAYVNGSPRLKPGDF
jgi:hypothetical protein